MTDEDPTDLTRMTHVGQTFADRLRDAGYETIDEVATASPADLAEIDGIPRGRAEKFERPNPLIGEPMEDVPKREASDTCNGKRALYDHETEEFSPHLFGGYCKRMAGEETDHPGEGRCKDHGGCTSGAPDPQKNGSKARNLVTHGAYAQENLFYKHDLSDELRELVVDIFADYYDRYTALHGEPLKGHETELFRLSVSHVKDIVLDNWAQERPEELDSGNPLIAKEEKYTDDGQQYEEFVESIVLKAQKRLSADRRQWLKDLDLLHDAEGRKADAMEDGFDLTLSTDEKHQLVESLADEPDT